MPINRLLKDKAYGEEVALLNKPSTTL